MLSKRHRYAVKHVTDWLNCDESDCSSLEESDDEVDEVSTGHAASKSRDNDYAPDDNGSDTEEESSCESSDETEATITAADSGSSDDEPLATLMQPKAQQKKKAYHWVKKSFKSPQTGFKDVSVQPPADGKPHSPLQYFQQFITDDMMTSVAENTNLYSTQKTGRCVTTTKKELEQVVGIYFRMGLVQMPGNRVYWENDTYYKPVAEVMSRNRFQLLLRSIHFVDNFCISDDQTKDKLWKIRPWLDKLRQNCQAVVPEEHNSVDEMTIAYKGRTSSIKQYIRAKPHPWGFKIWARTTATGILCD